MSAFSDAIEIDIIKHFLCGTSGITGAVGASLSLALFTADPGDTGYANEATYPGYVRRPIAFVVPTGTTGVTSNTVEIPFPANTGSSQIITHAAVYNNANTGQGTMFIHGQLVAPKTIDTNDVLSFAANALVLTVS